ncbi:MAG: hypothetical protein CMN94_02300 [Synechococcus sp. EAC657]|nr:hypothetical protein [Synechococcus sp. A15-60]MAN18602.1 hypothetical protein [Synechococcus sp. EAC657]MEC7897282.1 hypothetical protein [Cyanobacteriota bacterium]
MDLRLHAEGTSFRVVPASVHGILWLQTHFESEHWELLADGLITLCRDDAERVCSDAAEAGLRLNPLPYPTSSNRV